MGGLEDFAPVGRQRASKSLSFGCPCVSAPSSAQSTTRVGECRSHPQEAGREVRERPHEPNVRWGLHQMVSWRQSLRSPLISPSPSPSNSPSSLVVPVAPVDQCARQPVYAGYRFLSAPPQKRKVDGREPGT